MAAKIPVILDTDIGGDIDDTWALAYLLKCPELDLRLIVCSMEDTRYKAKIVAKLLEVAGRTDIPIAIGPATQYDRSHKTQTAWVKNYDLQTYPGTVYANGAAALTRVTDDGFTRVDDTGYPAAIALHWQDQAAFESHLVERLTTV